MPNIAVIGSQDVDLYEWLDDARPLVVPTRDKEVRGTVGKLHGVEIAFIPRNGDGVLDLLMLSTTVRTSKPSLVWAAVRSSLPRWPVPFELRFHCGVCCCWISSSTSLETGSSRTFVTVIRSDLPT